MLNLSWIHLLIFFTLSTGVCSQLQEEGRHICSVSKLLVYPLSQEWMLNVLFSVLAITSLIRADSCFSSLHSLS